MPALDGRYLLEEALDGPGMAWRGRDLALDRTVEVHLVDPLAAHDQAARQQLRRRATARARIDHPNIARVLDYGEATGEHGVTPYLVLEFVDGERLAARLARRGPLPWRSAARVGAQVAAALAAAHSAEVSHGALSASTVILTPEGVKVTGFGAAGRTARPEPGEAAATDLVALGRLLEQCLNRADKRAEVPPAALTTIIVALCRRQPATDAAAAARALAAVAGPGPLLPEWPDPRSRAARTIRLPTWPRPRDGTTRRLGLMHKQAPGSAAGLHGPARPVALGAGPALVVAGVLAATMTAQSAPSGAGPDRAEAAPGVSTGPSIACLVRYATRQLADGTFTADLAVTYQGKQSLRGWRLVFVLPAGQQVTDVAGARGRQEDGTVVLRGRDRLRPGDALTARLSGSSGQAAQAPSRFQLNARRCDRDVTRQPARPTTTPPARRPVAGAAAGSGAHRVAPPTPRSTAAVSPAPTRVEITGTTTVAGDTITGGAVPATTAPPGTPASTSTTTAFTAPASTAAPSGGSSSPTARPSTTRSTTTRTPTSGSPSTDSSFSGPGMPDVGPTPSGTP